MEYGWGGGSKDLATGLGEGEVLDASTTVKTGEARSGSIKKRLLYVHMHAYLSSSLSISISIYLSIYPVGKGAYLAAGLGEGQVLDGALLQLRVDRRRAAAALSAICQQLSAICQQLSSATVSLSAIDRLSAICQHLTAMQKRL